jgi:hypothetical protein
VLGVFLVAPLDREAAWLIAKDKADQQAEDKANYESDIDLWHGCLQG